MSSMTNEEVPCSKIVIGFYDDWSRIEQAFESASQPITMFQGWRETPEAAFEQASVRIGWTTDALWIFATLSDRDIYNAASALNERTWETGDAFEIFLKRAGDESYTELHVTPENAHLQLQFPRADALKSAPPEAYMLDGALFESITLVEPDRNRWQLLARVPASTVTGDSAIKADDRWLFSFSRYDYTRGDPTPVRSSTSSHKEIDFHNQQDWRMMRFIRPMI